MRLGLGRKPSLRLMSDLDLNDDTEVVVDDTEFFRGGARFLLPFAWSRAETWRGERPPRGVLRLGEPILCAERGWDRSVLFDDAERREFPSLAKLSRVGEAKRCRWLESRSGAERGIEGIRRCSRHSFPSRRISTLAGVVVGSRWAFCFRIWL